MSIQPFLKSTVVALAILTGVPLFAQGTPINTAAFDALVATPALSPKEVDRPVECHY